MVTETVRCARVYSYQFEVAILVTPKLLLYAIVSLDITIIQHHLTLCSLEAE